MKDISAPVHRGETDMSWQSKQVLTLLDKDRVAESQCVFSSELSHHLIVQCPPKFYPPFLMIFMREWKAGGVKGG